MFGDGYFSFSFPELVGTIVTIVGIWLVVRQLKEAKLASQMEGMISLAMMADDMRKYSLTHSDFTRLEEWEKLNDEEAYQLIRGNKEYQEAYFKQVAVYELVGGLVRAGSLNLKVADVTFGHRLPDTWKRYEKYTRQLRIELNSNDINENWEWLAKEFEKLNS